MSSNQSNARNNGAPFEGNGCVRHWFDDLPYMYDPVFGNSVGRPPVPQTQAGTHRGVGLQNAQVLRGHDHVARGRQGRAPTEQNDRARMLNQHRSVPNNLGVPAHPRQPSLRGNRQNDLTRAHHGQADRERQRAVQQFRAPVPQPVAPSRRARASGAHLRQNPPILRGHGDVERGGRQWTIPIVPLPPLIDQVVQVLHENLPHVRVRIVPKREHQEARVEHPEPAPLPIENPCAICGAAGGMHYSVVACQRCANFFARTSNLAELRCRENERLCSGRNEDVVENYGGGILTSEGGTRRLKNEADSPQTPR